MRSSWPGRLLPAVALAFAVLCGSSGSAHRADEYLQATRIAIAADAVEVTLDLTPGIAVADRVLDDIDRNGDGLIGTAEAATYAAQVLADLTVVVDDHTLTLDLVDFALAAPEDVRAGAGRFRLVAGARLPPMQAGAHRLDYRNGHRPDLGVYLANALIPASDDVRVDAQRRDVDQRTLAIEYTLRQATTRSVAWLRWGWLGGLALLMALTLWRRARASPA